MKSLPFALGLLQSGNNTYRLHRDAQYGRGGPHLKWHFHGPGRWVR